MCPTAGNTSASLAPVAAPPTAAWDGRVLLVR
jgi:hypothetical protein